MAAEQAASNDSLVGHTIEGRYELLEILGRGAVGTVYRVHDKLRNRGAALKLWNGTDEDEQAQARFLREAEALHTLSHPNIVRVFGAGLYARQPYVAMELLEGTTLEDFLTPDKPLSPPLAFDIARQFLSALGYAHRQGVVHRDLKPENIFLVRSPNSPIQVKLLDFGLAKFLVPANDPLGGAPITMTGVIMGTPLYMPPEQAAGGPIDLQVDVYAAGCILFEMLSGRLPYLGENYGELIRAHVTEPVPQLAAVLLRQYVAPEVQALLERAMAKNPAQRFATAGDMLSALQALPADAITSRPPPSLSDYARAQVEESVHTFKSDQPKRLALFIAGGALLLLLAKFLGWLTTD